MRKRHYWHMLIMFPSLFMSSCSDKKTLDIGSFVITVPKSWEFKPIKSIDSYAGDITGPNVNITFDYSGQGYASSLIETEKTFLAITQDLLTRFPDDQIDTIAERGDVISDLFLTGKIKPSVYKDTTVVISKINDKQKIQYPKADFIATIKIQGKVRYVPITIPHLIKSHYIITDTIGNYFRKVIYPIAPGKGMTGIYMHGRRTDFNFMMNAKNLSLKNQQLALEAFKTIKFK